MAKVIAIFNQSGGVGKSTLTMNLGYQIAQYDRRVLLLDMDPQASLTDFMGLDLDEQEPDIDLQQTIYQSLVQSSPLPIHREIHGMDLVPSNINLCGAEMELVVADMRDFRLKNALKVAMKQYDFILIDCPPSLGILSYISLVASTHILIPIQTHHKALKGVGLLSRTVQRVRAGANPSLKVAGFVPTLHDSRNSQNARTLETIETQLSQSGAVFPPIPLAIAFADATEESLPLALYNPKHAVFKSKNPPLDVLAKGVLALG